MDRGRRGYSSWILLAILCGSTSRAWADHRPVRLEVTPRDVSLRGATDRRQLVVTAYQADGSTRDVTGQARFSALPDASVSVSPSGVVTPRHDGVGQVTIEAEGRIATQTVGVVDATTPRPIGYRLDVLPVLSKAGCNMGACHGNLNGKGGFKLSLRGDDPEFDFASLTREAFGRRIDPARPDASLILLKPTGQVPHEGGLRFATHSPEAHSLRYWIASGVADDAGRVPQPVKLMLYPEERVNAAPCRAQQLLVLAEYSDGTRRDVTRQATFDLSDPVGASVSADGLVRVSAPGEVVVAVRYLQLRGVSRLAFLHDRPDFAWKDIPPNNAIDTHVFAKLKTLKIEPSEVASDAVFLRRAYLDAIGILPDPDEVRAFLADPSPSKRDRVIERLTDRPEFADFWALKWADLLRNEEKTMGAKGVWVFQRWLRDQVDRDLPMDEFARQILTATGSNWRNPPSSFQRTNRDPQTAAESVGQVFLGVRLQCARCHNHPFDRWTQDDYYGLAAYFGNIRRKDVANLRSDDLDKHEINGDEVIYFEGSAGSVQPRTGAKLRPKPPGGPPPTLTAETQALDSLATWLTKDNRQFARNLANRVWYHLQGRGIVDPVDDFRDSNPPSNPALLEALTDQFVEGGLRLKPLVAFIMKSKTYQLDSRPRPTNADDEANFARASIRLLPAEVLLDALSQALGKPNSFANAPRRARAAQLPGVQAEGSFLKVFGKPERLLTCECERSESTTLAQAFQLINGSQIRFKLGSEDNRIGQLLASERNDASIGSELYLAALGREPALSELEVTLRHVARAKDRRKAWEDVTWALLNSKEFLLRH